MGHPTLKKKSKRMSCKTRYKIDKKVREHNRKKKREARKQRKRGPKKDMVIAPNLCPFKQQIVEELNQAKIKEKEIKLRNRMEVDDEDPDPMMQIVQDARNQARGICVSDEIAMITSHEKRKSAMAAKDFTEVVTVADVILEVLDARDPLGTRCKKVEEAVLRHPDKRLVIVVNKADLVPADVLEKWLTYFRQSWPAVPFIASSHQQANKSGRRAAIKKSMKKKSLDELTSISSSLAAEFLIQLLANYRRNRGITTPITVGVVGARTVGKNSVIDSLKRSKSSTGEAEPEFKRTLQTVQICENIVIIDNPGIVAASPILKNNVVLCLKNLMRAEHKSHDPIKAARTVVVHATKEQLKSLYDISDYATPDDFLSCFAARFGLLGRKGVPDTLKAARNLVQDWNRGKIRFYTSPPEDTSGKSISATQAKEFALAELEAMEGTLLSVISDATESLRHCTYLHIHGNDDPEKPAEVKS